MMYQWSQPQRALPTEYQWVIPFRSTTWSRLPPVPEKVRKIRRRNERALEFCKIIDKTVLDRQKELELKPGVDVKLVRDVERPKEVVDMGEYDRTIGFDRALAGTEGNVREGPDEDGKYKVEFRGHNDPFLLDR